jgi:hypothetical protein
MALEVDSQTLDSGDAPQSCLARTRSAVLNVLVAVGLCIAVSGGLLRGRATADRPSPPRALHRELLAALVVIAVTSYATKRIMSQGVARSQRARRESVFYWSHVLPAVLAALSAPLGLVYGWWVDPRLQSVIPFWVAALALASLAIPRERELESLRTPSSNSGTVPS